MSDTSQPESRPDRDPVAEIPPLEWIIGGVGLAIVLAVVGILLFAAIAGDRSPPDIQLTVQSIAPLQHGYLVKVQAENVGGEPAARVTIAVEAWDQTTLREASETQFEHLPPHSTREAGVFFQRDPRTSEIRLHPRGYEAP